MAISRSRFVLSSQPPFAARLSRHLNRQGCWLLICCLVPFALSSYAAADDATTVGPASGDAGIAEAAFVDANIAQHGSAVTSADASAAPIPPALRDWIPWVMWGVDTVSPSTFRSAAERIAVWPRGLQLQCEQSGAEWQLQVTVFRDAWVALPGGHSHWPIDVTVNEQPLPVVRHGNGPAVMLSPGEHTVSGKLAWQRMPQRLHTPPDVGLLELTIAGQAVARPNRNADGQLWLRRQQNEQSEKDHLSLRVYRVLEDGIPLQLRTQVELNVSGKLREESLGTVLPAGFTIASVNSPLAVAVDPQGTLKAQVKPGTWTIDLLAFRHQDTTEVRFAESAKPLLGEELLAYRAQPQFRLAELEGLTPMDATQTTFPAAWRDLPLYRWPTNQPFRLTEKVRGMGQQRPQGLTVERQFWLAQAGQSMIYVDHVSGPRQQHWRLDASDDQELGAVRLNDEPQLLTLNPNTNKQGVELRSHQVNLQAVGQIQNVQQFTATGWQADVDQLKATFQLPPGWRALAVLGADHVQGDWLTAWTLLDLFLLLLFTLATWRIWGWTAGAVALLAFGLAYHEPGAPRLTWFCLLIPLALLRVVPAGGIQRAIRAWKYVAMALLALNLIPFLGHQIQTVIYPQLEIPGVNYRSRGMFATIGSAYRVAGRISDMAVLESSLAVRKQANTALDYRSQANLAQVPEAQIQTGPAQPQWSWNVVRCHWDGPVAGSQTLRPILLSANLHRGLTVLRILALVMLISRMLRLDRRTSLQSASASTAVASVVVAALLSGGGDSLQAADDVRANETSQPQQVESKQVASSQPTSLLPSPELLQQLKARALASNPAVPLAAEIAHVAMQLTDTRVTMLVEVHSTAESAVPLPGRVPGWSPLKVQMDGRPASLVTRREGYLWMVVPAGVHQVRVEAALPTSPDWEWTYLVAPHRVTVETDDWSIEGLDENGVPGERLLMARIQKADDDAQVEYDRTQLNAILLVERHLEIGLVWQVKTVVRRLSNTTAPVSLSIPLLPGERVLTPDRPVSDQHMNVSLASNQTSLSWSSQLPADRPITLQVASDASWSERWMLTASPVWNVAYDGLAPVYEAGQEELLPVWRPWPGESTNLQFARPTPVAGSVLTVQRVQRNIGLSRRQRTNELELEIDCSIGQEFVVGLPNGAKISQLQIDEQTLPVRSTDAGVVVPLRPGRQLVKLNWADDQMLGTVYTNQAVSLPAPSSNISTRVHVPQSRWVLWADGPMQGPAVRFWCVLVVAVLLALWLGRLPYSPLNYLEWILLSLGLTQVHPLAAGIVVLWLFAIGYRVELFSRRTPRWSFNLYQMMLVGMTGLSMIVLIVVVSMGLLGHPDMFILGNQSSRRMLNWFQPHVAQQLPTVTAVTISVWYYRLLMLLWALWLSHSLLGWLQTGWKNFGHTGFWAAK